ALPILARRPGPATVRRAQSHALARRPPRPLRPLLDGARLRVDRARHRLARPPDRRGARLMSTIRLAIAGVGNCASSLVQGITYYKDADPDELVPGLMHVKLGDYHVGDVELVAAFDVDATKVGIDLGKAILSGPNNTIKFAQPGHLNV